MKKQNKADSLEDRKLQHKIRTKTMLTRRHIVSPFYVRISDNPVSKTKEVGDGGVVVDFDKEGMIVGVEFLVSATLEI
jgi:hypothetical protein